MDICKLARGNALKYLHKTILTSAFAHDSYHKDALALIEGIINGDFIVCNLYKGYPSWDDWIISLHFDNKREIYDLVKQLHEDGKSYEYIALKVKELLLKCCTGKEGDWQRINTLEGVVPVSPEGAVANDNRLFNLVFKLCMELDEEDCN